MKIKNLVAAAGIAVMSASSAMAAVIDLGFIMDKSNSIPDASFASAMDALSLAIQNNIPVGGPDTYTISVIQFNDTASVVVPRTVIDSAATLANVVTQIAAPNSTSSTTNYASAFAAMLDQYTSGPGGTGVSLLGDKSLINMMTDGNPNRPIGDPDAAATSGAVALQMAGWDSLSFEAVGNNVDTSLLAGLGFSAGNTPTDATLLPVYFNANQITDPLTAPFVLSLADFNAYNSVIGSKVQKIVTPQVPLPAGMPLMIAGLAAFGYMRKRKQAA